MSAFSSRLICDAVEGAIVACGILARKEIWDRGGRSWRVCKEGYFTYSADDVADGKGATGRPMRG